MFYIVQIADIKYRKRGLYMKTISKIWKVTASAIGNIFLGISILTCLFVAGLVIYDKIDDMKSHYSYARR